MNPYEELANAIIVLAAKDYMKALKTLKKAPDNGTVLSENGVSRNSSNRTGSERLPKRTANF